MINWLLLNQPDRRTCLTRGDNRIALEVRDQVRDAVAIDVRDLDARRCCAADAGAVAGAAQPACYP